MQDVSCQVVILQPPRVRANGGLPSQRKMWVFLVEGEAHTRAKHVSPRLVRGVILCGQRRAHRVLGKRWV